MVIDRLMLYLFFILATLVSVIIFCSHPMFGDDADSFVDSVDPDFKYQRNYLEGEVADYEQQ